MAVYLFRIDKLYAVFRITLIFKQNPITYELNRN